MADLHLKLKLTFTFFTRYTGHVIKLLGNLSFEAGAVGYCTLPLMKVWQRKCHGNTTGSILKGMITCSVIGINESNRIWTFVWKSCYKAEESFYHAWPKGK